MMIMINNINNKMVLSFSFFTPTQIQLRFIFFFGLLLSFGLGDLRSIDDIQQTDSNSNANGLSLSENEPIEKLPQVKNDQLDLLFGLSGINQNQNVNSNEDLLQTQNDQLDLLADLSGVKQKENLPPSEKAKNPLDLLSDSSGTHDTGTQLQDGVQQNPYQKAYPNSNLQPSVPPQKHTLDLLSSSSGMRDNRMEFQQRSYQNANVEALPQPIQNNPYQGTQEPKTPILQPPRALSEYVLHQDFQEPALQHHEDLMARQLDDSDSADTDNDRGLEETDEENDWYHNADNVRDDIDEKDFDDFGERQNNDDLYDDDDDDDDGYNDDANAHNTAVDPDNVDTEMWSRFESRDKDTDNDDNNEVLDHNNEYYRGRFPTEDILNNLEDEVKKTKPPTAPTNMVLFYTWMILVILIMVIVVSTYQAKCKGLLSNGNRQQMRAVGEDRKRLLDNEFV